MRFRGGKLIGNNITLVPLMDEHIGPLSECGLDKDLWELQPRILNTKADMQRYVEAALVDRDEGLSIPYAVVHRASRLVIGSTRFMDISEEHRRVEIGATWLCKQFQRTGANTEMKLLMLTEAFDQWQVNKVVFKTEVKNLQSRHALRGIGALEEGIFRSHLLSDTGRFRDMVYFSILDNEWPAVCDDLSRRVSQYG